MWKKFREKMEDDITNYGLGRADSKYLTLLTFEKMLDEEYTRTLDKQESDRQGLKTL